MEVEEAGDVVEVVGEEEEKLPKIKCPNLLHILSSQFIQLNIYHFVNFLFFSI